MRARRKYDGRGGKIYGGFSLYEKRVLPNGVTLALERVDGVRSVSMGVWIRAGSRCELDGERGAAHFIEHMLFKGTASLTSAALAERMDALGAEFNAYTSRDCTSYYVRCLDVRAREAAGLLADMLTERASTPGTWTRSAASYSTRYGCTTICPTTLRTSLLVKSCFPGSLGLPVLGNARERGGDGARDPARLPRAGVRAGEHRPRRGGQLF